MDKAVRIIVIMKAVSAGEYPVGTLQSVLDDRQIPDGWMKPDGQSADDVRETWPELWEMLGKYYPNGLPLNRELAATPFFAT